MQMDFNNIPEDNFEKLAYLSTYNIENRKIEGLDIINKYPENNVILNIFNFVYDTWFDTIPGNYSIHKKVGFIGLNQAKIDFSTCFEQLITTNYRSSFDSLRRMYEMAVLQVYLSLDFVSEKEATEWKESENRTSGFTQMCKKIVNDDKFSNFNKSFDLLNNATKAYWKVCDIIHIKGISKSYMDFDNLSLIIDEIPIKKNNEKHIYNILDSLIEIFRVIVSLYTLNNPIILIGLPLFEKFGSNLPMSGFLNYSQSKNIWDILDIKYQAYFKHILESDESVKCQKIGF